MDNEFGRRIAGLVERWRNRMDLWQRRWLEKRDPPVTSLQLGRRSIFILPTWQGVMFGLGAMITLVIAVAERNPYAILLSALMLSLFLLSLVLCYRNLSGLQLQATEEASVSKIRNACFCGEQANFKISLSASSARRQHHDIWVGFSQTHLQPFYIDTVQQSSVLLSGVPEARGIYHAPRLLIQTCYPARLWRAWSRPHLKMSFLVYPRPIVCTLPKAKRRSGVSNTGPQSNARQSGIDDFEGLRDYSPGDSPRRIAWHTLARGHGLKTKRFVREEEPPLMLALDMFPGQEVETALSFLSYQVVQLTRQHRQKVGLQLSGSQRIEPGEGESHQHKMLQALALWE